MASFRSTSELWIISAPGEKTPQDTWDRLQTVTQNLSNNSKFNVPDLKVIFFLLRQS